MPALTRLFPAVLLAATFAPAVVQAADVLIYSDLNSDPEDVYDKYFSYYVNGVHSDYGLKAATAAPFTPALSSAIVRIELALGYFSGANEAEVSVRADADGLPGAVLASWKVKDMPPNFSCCNLVTIDVAGLPVVSGRNYWLVAKSRHGTDTYAGWHDNSLDEMGAIASVWGVGWFRTEAVVVPAFRITGQAAPAVSQ